MDARTTWLKCMISPGQFTGEFAISAQDHTGGTFSLFVNCDFVEHECGEIEEGIECEGRLLVLVLEERQGLSLIKLPGRTFANGSIVTVRSDQLESTAASQT